MDSASGFVVATGLENSNSFLNVQNGGGGMGSRKIVFKTDALEPILTPLEEILNALELILNPLEEIPDALEPILNPLEEIRHSG